MIFSPSLFDMLSKDSKHSYNPQKPNVIVVLSISYNGFPVSLSSCKRKSDICLL